MVSLSVDPNRAETQGRTISMLTSLPASKRKTAGKLDDPRA
jgi:hypothetical protein